MGQYKQLSRVELKSASKGLVEAVFSTFNVIDSDKDVTLPGAFEDGAEMPISGYQHTSWQGALPVGKGRIRTTRSEAVVEAQFFMNTAHGRDTFEVVKSLAESGLGEWSYGFDVVESDQGSFDGQDVRYLKRLKVHEVSPVLVGAGVGTRTLATKALVDRGYDPKDAARLVERTVNPAEYRSAIRPHEAPVVAKAWNAPAVLDELPAVAPLGDLRQVFAWRDPTGDPEAKSSYLFPHHHGPGGEANIRACLLGIAELNSPKCAIPAEDRRGVYNHLVAHLLDGDREAPELRSPDDKGPLKLQDELLAVMVGIGSVVTRASEVMALRAKKGKSLASSSVDLLEWLTEDLRRLRTALDSPQDDAAREYARYVQSQIRGDI